MGLFNKFTETVFVKSDNELENKVKILKELEKKYPNNEELKRDLMLSEQGLKGEKNIEFELKNANIGMYVLHDITFRYEDLKAQIDYIVITPAGQYFIECKNLIGNITVNDRGEFIREYEYHGKKIKEGFYSPLSQAERHIDIYKKIWNDKHSFIDKLFFEKDFDKYNIPLVVMANSKNILNVNYAPKEISNRIIRIDQLVKYLKKDLENTKWDSKATKKIMEEIANSYLDKNEPDIVDYEKKYINEKEIIKNKLIEFRTDKSKEKSIPAYYVFTNDELDKILEELPTTKEELKNILSDAKVQYHGDEIIDIIKKHS